jgi:CRP-like cAMP-binding protein
MHGKQSAEKQRIEELARVNRFHDFTDEEIGQVVDAATYLTVPEHWALMVEVARLGAGEVIGEMALVNHKLRSATVVADTPLEVLHFTVDTVAQLTAKIPHFRDALMGAVEERITRDQGS